MCPIRYGPKFIKKKQHDHDFIPFCFRVSYTIYKKFYVVMRKIYVNCIGVTHHSLFL